MAQTYTQIQRQIEALQKQAEKLKSTEVAGVVERIREAIAHYGLTPDQLFGTSKVSAAKKASGKVAGKSGGTGGASTAAYADGNGNVWGGRGPRPRWLRDALAAGKSLDEFATSTTPTKSAASATKKVANKRKAKTAYRDEGGNSWSGFGPKPRWLKEAMASGKTLEDFAASPSKN